MTTLPDAVPLSHRQRPHRIAAGGRHGRRRRPARGRPRSSPGAAQPGTGHVGRRLRRRRDRRASPAGRPAHRGPRRHRPRRGAGRPARSAGLDLAAAAQPALDAAAAALGARVRRRPQVGLDLVVADLGDPFTVVPLIGDGAARPRCCSATPRWRLPPPPLPPPPPRLPRPRTPRPASSRSTPPPRWRRRSARRGIEMLHGVDMEVTVELGRTRMTRARPARPRPGRRPRARPGRRQPRRPAGQRPAHRPRRGRRGRRGLRPARHRDHRRPAAS